MLDWLKGLGKSVWIAIGIFFAAMTVAKAVREKSIADKWKDVAVDIETGNVVKGVETAKAAMAQAKLHDSKARELQKKAKAIMDKAGKKDESTAVLLSRWKK